MKRTSDDNELLTVEEASAASKISPDGVRAAIRSGRLTATKKGNMWLIRRGDLKVWRPRGWRPPADE